jgi:hypothetical protein
MDDKNITTLDSVHKEKQAEFNYIKTIIIPKLKAEYKEIKQQLKASGIGIETRLEKNDRAIEISTSLREYKTRITDYYLKNNKYIFSYFETKKDISNSAGGRVNFNSGDPAATPLSAPAAAIAPANKSQLINSFFKVSNHDETVNIPHMKDQPSPSASASASTQGVFCSTEQDKMNFTNVQQYLYNNNQSSIDMERYTYRTDICTHCKRGEMVPIDSEGILVCNKCSNFIVYFVDNEKPSYKEPPKEACFYAYKRINHFREILAQFQAKETTQIDASIISAIERQIRKERLTLDQFTDTKAKEILKKLGYNKYYEHITFIKDKLGIKPPIMAPELEDTLCNLFMEIQRPYARFCPGERVNFLNYYYTIYKLCELLGQTQFLSYFPMLKDREKRIEQDEIWKNICKELNWVFIPTQ